MPTYDTWVLIEEHTKTDLKDPKRAWRACPTADGIYGVCTDDKDNEWLYLRIHDGDVQRNWPYDTPPIIKNHDMETDVSIFSEDRTTFFDVDVEDIEYDIDRKMIFKFDDGDELVVALKNR